MNYLYWMWKSHFIISSLNVKHLIIEIVEQVRSHTRGHRPGWLIVAHPPPPPPGSRRPSATTLALYTEIDAKGNKFKTACPKKNTPQLARNYGINEDTSFGWLNGFALAIDGSVTLHRNVNCLGKCYTAYDTMIIIEWHFLKWIILWYHIMHI